jgi:DNA-binding NtrC family response regulator
VVRLPPGARYEVGRDPSCDVPVAARRVSRRHVRVGRKGGRLWLEDLDTTNGTWLDEEPVRGRVPWAEGRVATVGPIALVVSRDSEAVALAGRERLLDALGDEVARARSFERPCSVVVLEGERLASPDGLREALQRLRPVDRASHLGPERLVVLQPERTAAEALAATGALPELSARAVQLRAGEDAEQLLSRAVADPPHPMAEAHSEGLVVASRAMEELLDTVDRVAPSRLTVLVLGETGAGKEVVARQVHERSDRRAGPMQSVNCGALPGSLLESTLFGHVKGAFTGAATDRPGLFEAADGGTLFLDEVGELSASAQAALLRVLETGAIRRVGDHADRQVDVRVVAATHRDLEAMARRGTFRHDLWFRLAGVVLKVPSLREQPEAIPPLVRHVVAEANARHGRAVVGPTEEAMEQLKRAPWPGNVRELRNAVERAVVVARGARFTSEDLGLAPVSTTPLAVERVDHLPAAGVDLKAMVRAREQALIVAAVRREGGNQTLAARRLGMPRRTLVYRLGQIDDEVPEVPLGEGSFREQVERYEGALVQAALERSDGDVGEAARLLSVQRRTLAAKLRTSGS